MIPGQGRAFGQRYTFASGIAVDVSNPEQYEPSSAAATAAGKVTGRAVLVTTTVTSQRYESAASITSLNQLAHETRPPDHPPAPKRRQATATSLITLAHAVCADETPLRVGPKTPKPGRKKAEKYLLVACTELYTHYLLGDRDLDTFKAFVLADLTESVLVHDRYHLYDSAELGALTHQLCCQHLCRDLDGAGEVYPDALWPAQIAEALRALMHQANLAREAGRAAIDDAVKNKLIKLFTDGVQVGLSDTTSHGDRPGERKARLVLEVLRDREADVLRFAHDLNVPATSNQAERDLRPSKTQQKISGRLTSEQRTKDRYRIRGYLSTAAKHGLQHDGRPARRDHRPTLDPTRPHASLTSPTPTSPRPARMPTAPSRGLMRQTRTSKPGLNVYVSNLLERCVDVDVLAVIKLVEELVDVIVRNRHCVSTITNANGLDGHCFHGHKVSATDTERKCTA